MFIISLILLQIIIFAGLAFFLKHLLSKNVTNATSHLQGMIRENTEKQDAMNKKLEDTEKECEDKLKKAKEEAEQMQRHTRKELEAEREKILAQAHAHSEELMSRAKKTCDNIMADIEHQVDEKAIARSAELVCKVIPEKNRYDMHTEWVRALVGEGMDSLDRLRIPDDVSTVQVITAFPLTEQEKSDLHNHLQVYLKKELILVEKLQPEIVAGIIVNIGTLVLDGSLASRVREVIRES